MLNGKVIMYYWIFFYSFFILKSFLEANSFLCQVMRVFLQHCTGNMHFARQKNIRKMTDFRLPQKFAVCHDIPAQFPDSRIHKYAEILISADYIFRTYSGAISANFPYSFAKNSLWTLADSTKQTWDQQLLKLLNSPF